MTTLKCTLLACITAGIALVISCSTGDIAVAPGTGSETTNGFAATIVYRNGTPAAHAVVRLRPRNYLADTSSAIAKTLTSREDVLTDDSGRFSIDSLDTGSYLIEAADANGNAVAIACTVRPDSIIGLGKHALAPMGTIAGTAGGPSVRAFVRVRGLERCAGIDANGRFAMSVPSSQSYAINIANADTSLEDTLLAPINPAQTLLINVDFGTYRTDSLAVRAFLDNLGFQTLPVDSVTKVDSALERITVLRLTGRNLSAIPQSIGTLSFLYELSLAGNPLTDLPSSLADLPHLYHLYLDSMPMTKLPDCVPRILSLRLLQINYTQITTLPAALSNCLSLNVISMKGTGATQFPLVVTAMPWVRTLNISENPISVLPSSISSCVNLDHFEMHDTWIDSLPSSIGSMQKLRGIYAYGSRLSTLPASIGLLISLELLNLNSNPLTSLPAELGNCTSLNNLSINTTPLSSLPISIVNIHPVNGLSLVYNHLCTLPPEVSAWADTYAESTWRSTQTCP